MITTHQSPSGAYPASPDFSAYRGYSWLRDGAFIAEGMSRHAQITSAIASATAFHAWCARVVTARARQVESLVARAGRGQAVPVAEMLPTRFTLDGGVGADEWWDHQLDGYGTWLWAAGQHVLRHGTHVEGLADGVRVAARYLAAFWDQPCYDWWEEHVDQRHVATLGAIHAGLRAARDLGVLDRATSEAVTAAIEGIEALITAEGVADAGHLRKWLGSDAVDGSLLACVTPFGLYPAGHRVAAVTVAEVERQLAVDGGVHRYLADTFYGGGRWILLSGFLGWNHARAGRPEAALRYLEWMAAQATEQGELPEQVSGALLAPERYQEWVGRWGSVATPLLWSHGMYLILADELGVTA
ncbi:hypothetical protein J5X84_24775 [Streptosporangiaceae bacterium NEAU-GS5]|nr:hypothetical protein [Streptosporangiaceae bacterium NEAU-GS5]